MLPPIKCDGALVLTGAAMDPPISTRSGDPPPLAGAQTPFDPPAGHMHPRRPRWTGRVVVARCQTVPWRLLVNGFLFVKYTIAPAVGWPHTAVLSLRLCHVKRPLCSSPKPEHGADHQMAPSKNGSSVRFCVGTSSECRDGEIWNRHRELPSTGIERSSLFGCACISPQHQTSTFLRHFQLTRTDLPRAPSSDSDRYLAPCHFFTRRSAWRLIHLASALVTSCVVCTVPLCHCIMGCWFGFLSFSAVFWPFSGGCIFIIFGCFGHFRAATFLLSSAVLTILGRLHFYCFRPFGHLRAVAFL